MMGKSSEELYNIICRELLNVKWPDDMVPDQQFIKSHIKSSRFINKISTMIKEGDYSCKSVLSLASDMLNEISGKYAPPNWLEYIYRYTLSKPFPDAVAYPLLDKLDVPCAIYLKILRAVSQYQATVSDGTWQSMYPLSFLSPQEINELEYPAEYKCFIQAYNNDYIYELMKLSREVLGFNTIDHVCGVHYLSLYIGRQLKSTGLPVDLGRVSGAAAGHDIGKYGCKESELNRVPYLHYYYTDMWFKKYDITYIRHIAINHSTWDLELENLPLESLILIYSDFRVKNGEYGMSIFPLSQSFDIMLGKLDNLNESKERRYRRVYAKLKDFEDYMIHLGIDINPPPKKPSYSHGFKKVLISSRSNETRDEPLQAMSEVNYALLQGRDIIQNIKYLSISHNINLMYRFRNEFSLENILQSARSQKDWKVLREYIRVFEEYSTYFTPGQKLQVIKFLYEQLIHPEDDIRRHCAELIGTLIAIYDEDYRKELPHDVKLPSPEITGTGLFDEYLKLFLHPGHKIIAGHRAWIGYSTSIMVSSLFSHCKSRLRDNFKKVLLSYFEKGTYRNNDTLLYLLKTAACIPLSPDDQEMNTLLSFVLKVLSKRNVSLRLSALETVISIASEIKDTSMFREALKNYFESGNFRRRLPAENYLILKAARELEMDRPIINKLESCCKQHEAYIADIFLSNLKTATDWVVKKINVEMLLDHTLKSPEKSGLHTAMHFCNLLKVSAVENVRSLAGESILKIVPCLPVDQRNDVAVELIRALEIEGNRFTEYIPHYLGRLVLWLKPVELDELIDDLVEKMKQSDPRIKCLLLKTMGISIENYPAYVQRFGEDLDRYNKRLVKMLGILLNGLGDYNSLTRQVALSVFGKEIFGSKRLDLDYKNHIFKLTAKKILTLMTDNKNEVLLLLANSAGLNHIYRFISDYTFFKGTIDLKLPDKVAFFPGTFDPFTLSHKEIVKAIRDMGFEVYLSVDEFSWSKRTLPNLLRRKIINMSIADELNVYLYPKNIPINIANHRDLSILRQSFPNLEIYIAVGSDVLMNASGYAGPKSRESIHSFPHILIERENGHNKNQAKLDSALSQIDGKIVKLSLPKQFTNISSSQIRNYIDKNRDISSMVDPLVQQYIYRYDFYRREPQEKALLTSPLSIDVQEVRTFSPAVAEELSSLFNKWDESMSRKLYELLQKPSARLLLLKDTSNNSKLMGFSAFHWMRSGNMYRELKDSSICDYIRDTTAGRTILIDGLFVDGSQKSKDLEQILLTETLSLCLSRDYECAIYYNILSGNTSPTLYEILRLQGFVKLPVGFDDNPIYMVNMSNPCTLNLDVESVIKKPFVENYRVRQSIMQCRKRLQEAMTGLYPGQLILSFDINIQHEMMIKKICAENGVPDSIVYPRKLGPAMCVPYGNILDRYVVPNTVTKALHTEKMFRADMKGFKIGAFPHYLDLDTQVKVIRSFNRPVILVDDLLHKGHRLRAIDPLFKRENIQVQKIIVGILSGRGKELMDVQNRQVDSVYFLPKVRVWFNENSLYPFIGGDALLRGTYPERNLLPSINMILPYASPGFIKGASMDSIYNLSKVSIENAMEILSTLESEYHELNERNLTLSSLGEVFVSPRCPDKGMDVDYNLNLSPSHFLKNDLELLCRLERSFKGGRLNQGI